MTKEDKFKDELERLEFLRRELLEKVKIYNELATQVDHTERVGLASVNFEWYGDEEPENIQEYMADDYDKHYVTIEDPGVQGYWFPSDVNC